MTTAAAPVSAHARAGLLLDSIKSAAADSPWPEGAALWWAADGLGGLLRNNSALGEAVEAIAARVLDAITEP